MNSGTIDPVSDLVADPRRRVELDAVHNFRDLGGYPARDGAVTRWGMLYRADGLHRMTPADVETVRELGLRTVVDLRSTGEIDRWGTFPHDRIDVELVHHPVIDRTWDHDPDDDRSDHDFLVWAYTDMLAVGGARFARAIDELARPGALPAVFHCAAGKDRTGLLAALVLESLGVPRSVVLADYELTVEGMQRLSSWLTTHHPELAAGWAQVPSAFLAAVPSALDEVLVGLHLQGGGPFVANDELDRRLLAEAGASGIVMMPTADAFEHPERLVAAAMTWGERLDLEVEALMVLGRADALDEGAAGVVRRAKVVYLVGDQPLHLRSVLKDTPVWTALGDVLAAGGVVVGVGGSGSALCDPMVDPRGGAFTLGLGMVNGVAFVSASETWSLERLHRTLKLANTPVLCSPTGSAAIVRDGAWEHVGAIELHGDL
ncbi:MAG: tyrosine-protein phosphatase [Actinobacteria bacterium]|nr:tyrosine-protein phosphatase [Actinomycetota bacterium]